jgi:hypothetical protein
MKEYILVGIDESQDKYNREKQLKSFKEAHIARENREIDYDLLMEHIEYASDNGFDKFFYISESEDWPELNCDLQEEVTIFKEVGVIPAKFGRLREGDINNNNYEYLVCIYPFTIASFSADGQLNTNFEGVAKAFNQKRNEFTEATNNLLKTPNTRRTFSVIPIFSANQAIFDGLDKSFLPNKKLLTALIGSDESKSEIFKKAFTRNPIFIKGGQGAADKDVCFDVDFFTNNLLPCLKQINGLKEVLEDTTKPWYQRIKFLTSSKYHETMKASIQKLAAVPQSQDFFEPGISTDAADLEITVKNQIVDRVNKINESKNIKDIEKTLSEEEISKLQQDKEVIEQQYNANMQLPVGRYANNLINIRSENKPANIATKAEYTANVAKGMDAEAFGKPDNNSSDFQEFLIKNGYGNNVARQNILTGFGGQGNDANDKEYVEYLKKHGQKGIADVFEDAYKSGSLSAKQKIEKFANKEEEIRKRLEISKEREEEYKKEVAEKETVKSNEVVIKLRNKKMLNELVELLKGTNVVSSVNSTNNANEPKPN